MRFCAAVVLSFLACIGSLPAEGVPERNRPLLGVQRWDMYSGKGYTYEQELGYKPGGSGFLKPAQWHDRAPFFCRLTKDVDWVEHPPNAGPLWFNYPFSQELLEKSMDQEIRYAYNAGIDFFIYHGPAVRLTNNRDGWSLLNNLHCHMESKIPEAGKMHFVWALYGHEAMGYTRSRVAAMMDETMDYIKRPNWQKVMDGRPLVMVIWPEHFRSQLHSAVGEEQMIGTEFVDYIRKRVTAAGLKNPYVVGMANNRSHKKAVTYKAWGYDAFMDYDGSHGGALAERDRGPTYAQATGRMIETLESHYVKTGMPFIPPVSSMCYLWPRAIDHETGKLKKVYYHYQWPKKGDLADRIDAAFDFVAAHPEACEAQVISMYSWNECSEGGGLIPTMGKPPAYKPDTTWLDEVAAALAKWNYPTAHGKAELGGLPSE